jgi:hypothetical protein
VLEQVRIDPANQAGITVINRIEIGRGPFVEVYTAQQVFKRLKPLSLIGGITLESDGVHIASTGNDPSVRSA